MGVIYQSHKKVTGTWSIFPLFLYISYHFLNPCLWHKNTPILGFTSDLFLSSAENSSTFQCRDHFLIVHLILSPSWLFLWDATESLVNQESIHTCTCMYMINNTILKYKVCRSTIPWALLRKLCDRCPKKCIRQLCTRERMCTDCWLCSSRTRRKMKTQLIFTPSKSNHTRTKVYLTTSHVGQSPNNYEPLLHSLQFCLFLNN